MIKPFHKLNPETKKTAVMASIKEIIFDKYKDSFKTKYLKCSSQAQIK